ncbi:MAG TPA: metallophosphoesterase [Blastocatellia bacterium]|nr:metallophosphoesterase [Blastocatellia bacterium]
MSNEHFEPFLYLAGLTHDAALIAWGGFFFKTSAQSGRWKLIDDGDLKKIEPPRGDTIGASSKPYGKARVEVRDSGGNVAGGRETSEANHCWIENLSPDTEYTYRVFVNGQPWAEGELYDWSREGGQHGLLKSGRVYDNRFRTHPAPDSPASLTFAAIGDFGVGVRKESSNNRRQIEIAEALEKAADSQKIRIVLTTGDNIYAGKTFFHIPIGATGDEDDDWFFTFYQPYRYVINRIPFYPACGNHDTMETESSDDRKQLEDNFYINERFSGPHSSGPVSRDPGLFYRFGFGSNIEFVCVDTTRKSMFFGTRFYDHDKHREFMDTAFPPGAGTRRWLIPFMHHPVFSAGPTHKIHSSMVERLGGRFVRSGVRIVLAGHEHNYQHALDKGVNYFITGSAGKVSTNPPSRLAEAHTVSWASQAHLLLVELSGDTATVRPIGGANPNGGLVELNVNRNGQLSPGAVTISAGG